MSGQLQDRASGADNTTNDGDPTLSLGGLGLGSTAETVYRAMLRHSHAGVAELSAECDIGEAETRAALDELARLSLLRPSWEDPTALTPVNPEVGLASLLTRQQEELTTRQRQIEASRAAMATLVADYADQRPRTPDPDVEQLVGIDQIRLRLEELSRTCTYEALSLMPGGAQAQANLEASRPLDEDTLNRGVRVRTILLESIRNDPPTLEYAQWMTEQGGEVRTAPDLPLRMLVIDRKLALVPVSVENTGARALLLHSPGIVAALHALFDSVWKGSRPLGRRERPRDSRGLTNQQRVILNLLGQGCTDELIARRLDVSVRTVRRVIAQLMDRLDAQSRFQAGALAQVEGWLDLT